MAKKAYRDSFIAAHISNTVAAQISSMREARGWTQKQLAEKAGMKQSRVSVLEDPNYENFEAGTLRRIASAFDVGLSIRFVPFSDIARFASEITDEALAVASFGEESLDSLVRASATRSRKIPVLGAHEIALATPFPTATFLSSGPSLTTAIQ